MTAASGDGAATRLDRYFERLIAEHRMRLREPKTEAERLTLALNGPPEYDGRKERGSDKPKD